MSFNTELLITQFVHYLEGRGISIREAERLMGISNATLKKAIDNKSLSKKMLKKIREKFNDFQLADKPPISTDENQNQTYMMTELIEQLKKNIELLERENESLRAQLGLVGQKKQHKAN